MSDNAPPTSPWDWEDERGSAEDLHDWRPPDSGRPTVRELFVEEPALVLGSSQPADDVDREAAAAQSIAVVRRRSGGGAVLLIPGEHLWLDVWLPAAHSLWSDDVVASSAWLGATWNAALGRLGIKERSVHAGPLVSTPWSPFVCFAGLGPGEVLSGHHKLIGVSQRRTRDWARFQCLVHLRWRAELNADLVVERRRPHGPLPAVATLDAEGAVTAFREEIQTT